MSNTDLMVDLFGRDLALFLRGCDRLHPDLKDPPMAMFLDEADQIVRAADFCGDEGLIRPLGLLCESSPKSIPRLISMTRVLKDAFRRDARSKKSEMTLGASRLLKELQVFGDDLPDSFDPFRDRELGMSFGRRWSAAARELSAVGCDAMAASAEALASCYTPGEIGFHRLPIRRAAIILLKRSARHSGARIIVSPVRDGLLPPESRIAIDESEWHMGGFPVFDHHIFVALSDGESSPARGFVVLGERDGECYFLCSD